MFKRNLSLVIAAMLGAVLIACGSTDTAKTTKKAVTESTEAATEIAKDTQSEETALTETQDKTETADGTVADSEKQQDSSSDKKSSEKDSASAKQETAGKDKTVSTSSSSGSKTSGSSTSSGKSDTAKSVNSSGGSGSGKTTSGSTGKTGNTGNTGSTGNAGNTGNTSNTGNTGSNQETHTHTWYKYVANTIQHKEEGHYETKVVKEAYEEPQYTAKVVCGCGKIFDNIEAWADHETDDNCMLGYSVKDVQTGTIHHEAEKQQVWVVDTPAYTEYVYGEKCSGCGATK